MADASILSEQVEAYHAWKKELIRQITRYRHWLQGNELLSDDVAVRIQRGIELLVQDELTIAFIGEYSRGKTELINALFFSGYGQRMLPSEAGRTTMCPTELFFDRRTRDSYVRLLPVESRQDDTSLHQLKLQPDAWEEVPLPTDNADAMRDALARVAEVKSVTREEAQALGFDENMLDHDREQQGRVLVPAWRHALISVHHPLLEKGLRILDTPGLNALGSEPELTISMLPSAQAVIFLLAADAGVTASDMAIWKDYVDTHDADHRAGRFAVLNKIDVLWDDLQGEEHTNRSIERVTQLTAEQLGLGTDEVLPLSAKQALISRVRQDHDLRERSRLPALEKLIIERILIQKEELIAHNLVSDILGMLQNNQSALQTRLDSLEKELAACQEGQVDRKSLQELADQTRSDYDYYYRKLITLRSSRRLVQSQGDVLKKMITLEAFEAHAETTRSKLEGSWTSIGLQRAMSQFFQVLENEFNNLMSEGRLADKMVGSIYNRYNRESRGKHLEPIPLRLGRQLIALRDLRAKADRFRLNPRSLLLEQSLLIRRFFATIVSEAREIRKRTLSEIERWPEEALLPVLQYSMEQKKLLEHQFRRLGEMARTEKSINARREAIEESQAQLRQQLKLAQKIERKLRQPPPSAVREKVVQLGGIA